MEVVAGTATAGIPHASWVADMLELPMSYIRASAKEHGKKNQIEGKMNHGQKVVIIEDLISTGKSSLAAVKAVKEAGADVLGVVGIFSYGFARTKEEFAKMDVRFETLTNYQTLIKVARNEGILSTEELSKLEEWKPF